MDDQRAKDVMLFVRSDARVQNLEFKMALVADQFSNLTIFESDNFDDKESY